MKPRLLSRVLLGHLTTVALLAITGAGGVAVVDRALHDHRTIRQRQLPNVAAARELLSDLRAMEDLEYTYFLPASALPAAERAFDGNAHEARQLLGVLADNAASPSQRQDVAQLDAQLASFLRVDDQERALLARGQVQPALALDRGRSLELFQGMERHLVAFRRATLAGLERELAQEDQALTGERGALVAAVLGALALALGASFALSVPVARAIALLRDRLAQLAEGRFTALPVDGPFAGTTEFADLRDAFDRTGRQVVELQHDLEAKVAERTAELTRALAELKALDQAKDDFQATVTHELLTPINFITGFGSALLDEAAGPLSPEQARLVEKMLGGADRLTGLVRNILDHARLVRGDLPLHVQAVDLVELARSAVAEAGARAEAKWLEVELEAPEEPVLAAADPSRVLQVLFNLLDNAIKFTSPRGTIKVKVANAPPGGEVQVCDSGEGIPAHALPRVGDPFYQADGTSTRAHGGAGLGLAIVKRLLDLQNGTLEVQSELGKGTCVRVGLPAPPELEGKPAVTAVRVREDRELG